MVGGYCSTFRRGGYTFDAATHFYPLLGNPETLTGKLLVDLGVETGWVRMDPVDTFHFPDGSRFEVPADFATYRAAARRALPAPARAARGVLRRRARGVPARPAGLLPRPRHAAHGPPARGHGARRPRPPFPGRQAQAPAHRRLPALGLAAAQHVVRLRLDAAPVLLPRQLLPGGRQPGLRRRAGALLRGAGRRHPDVDPRRAHRDRHRRAAAAGAGRRAGDAARAAPGAPPGGGGGGGVERRPAAHRRGAGRRRAPAAGVPGRPAPPAPQLPVLPLAPRPARRRGGGPRARAGLLLARAGTPTGWAATA